MLKWERALMREQSKGSEGTRKRKNRGKMETKLTLKPNAKA